MTDTAKCPECGKLIPIELEIEGAEWVCAIIELRCEGCKAQWEENLVA